MSQTESAPPKSGWERAKLVLKVVEVRLRFIAILVLTGLVIGYWDTLENHWDKWRRPPPGKVVAGAETEFFCPMHPNVIRPGLEPNGEVPRCPICGMPLSQRKKGAAGAATPGRVQLSPDRIVLAGVRTEEITARRLEQEIVATGTVQYDESRLSRIVARVNGYLERLHVDKSFVAVTEGEPLAEIYSPELYTSVRELLLAQKTSPDGELANAARERLKLLGIDEKELEKITSSGKSDYRLVIRSPQSGHVIQREVVRGSYVTVGTTLFEVADLTKVWIEADVFEKDVPFLREGTTVEAWVEAFPNRVFMGTIQLVHPHVDAATRTNTVRFAVENPGCDLRPGMFTTVRMRQPLAAIEPFKALADAAGTGSATAVLAVPERAVIDTGSRKVVYREVERGVFLATKVELGPRVGDYYPIVSGLEAGDRVAAAGSFLIDAETRLNPAAGATFTGASGGPSSGGAHASDPPPDTESWKELSPEDRKLALEQKTCPISGDKLGSMGTPRKTIVNGHAIFICCDGCKPELEDRAKKDHAHGDAGKSGGK